jgi:hypothetical protein
MGPTCVFVGHAVTNNSGDVRGLPGAWRGCRAVSCGRVWNLCLIGRLVSDRWVIELACRCSTRSAQQQRAACMPACFDHACCTPVAWKILVRDRVESIGIWLRFPIEAGDGDFRRISGRLHVFVNCARTTTWGRVGQRWAQVYSLSSWSWT